MYNPFLSAAAAAWQELNSQQAQEFYEQKREMLNRAMGNLAIGILEFLTDSAEGCRSAYKTVNQVIQRFRQEEPKTSEPQPLVSQHEQENLDTVNNPVQQADNNQD